MLHAAISFESWRTGEGCDIQIVTEMSRSVAMPYSY
jgi:hypothetical protein